MVQRQTKRIAASLLALSLLGSAPVRAAVADEQATVDHAVGTLQDLRHDKEFGNARSLLHRAPRHADRAAYFQGRLLRRR